MDTTYPARVAAKVAEAMETGGWSESKMADATGIPRVTLRRRLAGSPFTVAELSAIASVLKVAVSDLIAESAA